MRKVKQMSFWPKLIVSISIIGIISGFTSDIHANNKKAERDFPIPGHGSLKLIVPETWVDTIKQSSKNPFATITFTPDSGESFEILITPMYNPIKDEDFNKPQKIKNLVERSGKKLLPISEETELKIRGLKGPSCWGYYFRSTDKAPKPGEYKYLTQGAIGVGELLLTFTILTNQGFSQIEKEAITMLRRARQEISPEQEEKLNSGFSRNSKEPHVLKFTGEPFEDKKTETFLIPNRDSSSLGLVNFKYNFLLMLPYCKEWAFTFHERNLLSGNAGMINLSLDIFIAEESEDQFLSAHRDALLKKGAAIGLIDARIKEFDGDNLRVTSSLVYFCSFFLAISIVSLECRIASSIHLLTSFLNRL